MPQNIHSSYAYINTTLSTSVNLSLPCGTATSSSKWSHPIPVPYIHVFQQLLPHPARRQKARRWLEQSLESLPRQTPHNRRPIYNNSDIFVLHYARECDATVKGSDINIQQHRRRHRAVVGAAISVTWSFRARLSFPLPFQASVLWELHGAVISGKFVWDRVLTSVGGTLCLAATARPVAAVQSGLHCSV